MSRFQTILIFSSLLLINTWANAGFEIRKPCLNEQALSDNTGTLHKYYASMLAFNSNPPECLHNIPVISSSQVEQVNLSNDPNTNDVVVDIRLSEEGKKLFAEYTSNHPQQQIAMMVDDKILSLLTVVEPITTGIIQIRGLWYEDAVRLSNAIKSDHN